MKNRYNIKGSDGSYCESRDKADLVYLRKINPLFKGKHIKYAIQACDDIVLLNIIYPPSCINRNDFIDYNKTIYPNINEQIVTNSPTDKTKYIILEGIKHFNRFFTSYEIGKDPTKGYTGEIWYRILGYAETMKSAQSFLGYRV